MPNTYSDLKSDLQNYADRHDDVFIDQIPRLIDNAETKIAAEARGLGFLRVVTGTMASGSPIIVKPSRWRETVSFNFGENTAAARRNFLLLRSYEYCRAYWPAPTSTGTPKFWADYDYEHFLIAPTPNAAYAFELSYHEKPEPLSDANQESWTTRYAYPLLLYASLLEAQPFLHRAERIQEFQLGYETAKAALAGEDVRRITTKNQAINR